MLTRINICLRGGFLAHHCSLRLWSAGCPPADFMLDMLQRARTLPSCAGLLPAWAANAPHKVRCAASLYSGLEASVFFSWQRRPTTATHVCRPEINRSRLNLHCCVCALSGRCFYVVAVLDAENLNILYYKRTFFLCVLLVVWHGRSDTLYWVVNF